MWNFLFFIADFVYFWVSKHLKESNSSQILLTSQIFNFISSGEFFKFFICDNFLLIENFHNQKM